jgi:hypothetical protein
MGQPHQWYDMKRALTERMSLRDSRDFQLSGGQYDHVHCHLGTGDDHLAGTLPFDVEIRAVR